MGEIILENLRAATEGHAVGATEADAVDSMPARWVALPVSTEQTAAVMRVAAHHDLAVVVRGSGTKLTWGARPERVDLVLDTTRMDTVVEHAAGDLIVVVGAGRRLDDLQAALSGSGQWLAVDPPRRGPGGGPIATGAPRPAPPPPRPGRRRDGPQAALSGSGQWLAVDPPRRGTVGGLIATAATGPTRLLHGPVRDLLIGA